MESSAQGLSVRRSVPGDEPELKRLWQAVFGDSSAFIDRFFEMMYAPGTACLALLDGGLASAGYCLPGVTARGKSCAYIYAVATYPRYRGMGAAAQVCRRLAELAFEDGADIVATLPAQASLTDWYERVLNMSPTFIKGAPGAEFSDPWLRFAEYCGTAESGAPDRLWAVGAPGVDIAAFRDVGWALTFE